MYSNSEIANIRGRIKAAGLIQPAAMKSYNNWRLRTICNGIGAEWMSEHSRKIITKMLKYAEAAAAIHDFEYYISDGDEARRKAVDEIFLLNALREVRFFYPKWYDPRRWFGERAVLAAHEILSRTGGLAWRDAFASRVLKEFQRRGITATDFFKKRNKK